jgi:putative membrane protein
MFFGPLLMIGGPILLIILIVVLVQALGSRRETPGVRLAPSPREILDERFAKGEIERDEYEERKKLLSS